MKTALEIFRDAARGVPPTGHNYMTIAEWIETASDEEIAAVHAQVELDILECAGLANQN